MICFNEFGITFPIIILINPFYYHITKALFASIAFTETYFSRGYTKQFTPQGS